MSGWPELPYAEWRETCLTLQRWLQIAGKVRLGRAPWINHSWGTTLYVTSRGLGTSLIPEAPGRSFSIEFDFLDHQMRLQTTRGESRAIALRSQPVAEFYAQVRAILGELGIESRFAARPDETPDRIPFAEDRVHQSYDPRHAHRYWQSLVRVDAVFQEFRSRFVGKCSPVHLFWGSLDLAVTRFSGRRAPEHPGGVPNLSDEVCKEAYSHEVSSCGFWPGSDLFPEPAFYSYAYPQPSGFERSRILPEGAFYHERLREFILPYDRVRASPDPEGALLEFLQSSYEAAAGLGKWDRSLLEESPFLGILQRKHPGPIRPERAA